MSFLVKSSYQTKRYTDNRKEDFKEFYRASLVCVLDIHIKLRPGHKHFLKDLPLLSPLSRSFEVQIGPIEVLV